MTRAICVAFVLTLLHANAASAAEYPILFVHGFCSDSSVWNRMFDNLPRGRFGDELARYYQGADGAVHLKEPLGSRSQRSFTIDFYDSTNRTFNPRIVADIPVVRKVEQLKAVIDQVKIVTGNSKVIIAAHSMGGLVARSYVQGWSLNSSGRPIAYADDVAGLITIDTPHQGSNFAGVPLDLTDWDPSCSLVATVNKSEMLPGSTFLGAINNRSWPANTRVDAIVSYYLDILDSDGIVSRDSQDIRTISDYWATHLSVRSHLQRFIDRFLPGLPGLLLHTATTRSPVTASLVQSIVQEIDDSAVNPLPSSCRTAQLPGNGGFGGELTDGDCLAPHRPQSRADVYSLQASAGQRIQLTMDGENSPNGLPDPYIILVDSSGAVVAEDDDSGVGTNASIDHIARLAGRYSIEATSYDALDRGRYLLQVTVTNETPPPNATPICRTVAVPATAGGTVLALGDGTAPIATGLAVRAGDRITFAASGTLTIFGATPSITNGPNGLDYRAASNFTFLLPDSAAPGGEAARAAGALVARVGASSFFFVGSQAQLTADRAGSIELAINDIATFFYDNVGGFTATACVYSGSTPAPSGPPNISGSWTTTSSIERKTEACGTDYFPYVPQTSSGRMTVTQNGTSIVFRDTTSSSQATELTGTINADGAFAVSARVSSGQVQVQIEYSGRAETTGRRLSADVRLSVTGTSCSASGTFVADKL